MNFINIFDLNIIYIKINLMHFSDDLMNIILKFLFIICIEKDKNKILLFFVNILIVFNNRTE